MESNLYHNLPRPSKSNQPILRYKLAAILSLGTFITIAILIIWLSRGDWLYPEQPQTTDFVQSTLIGQTFVASQAGLMALEIKIRPMSAITSAKLTLQIRNNPTETQNTRQVTLTTPLNNDGWIRFNFDPIPTSRGVYYYFFLTSDHPVTLFHGPAESYPDGALYLNGQSQTAQLTFRAAYNRWDMASELLQNIVFYLPAQLIAFSTFFIAGWTLLVLSQAHDKLITNWVEGFIVALGLSLAWYPLLLLWTDTIGLHLGQGYIWLTFMVSLAILTRYYHNKKPTLATIDTWLNSPNRWSDLALLIIITIAILGRVLMARRLELPLWDDSVHHTIVVRRILESGGLFQSWQPYTPYETLSFHFGFHVNMAVLAWATGMSAAQAVIWGGQAINLLAALALYPLAYRWQGRWAGVLTVLIASMFTQFPLYYVNWGRYAQLMGQVILPLACWWTLALLTQKKLTWQQQLPLWLGGALLIFGTVIAYYRMAFHYLAFLIALSLVHFPTIKETFQWRRWLPIAAVLLMVIIFASAWFIPLSTLHNLGVKTLPATQTNQAAPLWVEIQTFQSGSLNSNLAIFMLGTFLTIWGGRKFALPIAWLWLLITLPLLKFLPLPGVSIIQEFTIQTSLYMLQATMWGLAGGWLLDKIIAQHELGLIASVLIITLIILIKLPQLPQIIDRDFDLSGRPDLRAADWIHQNLHGQAVFLINGLVYDGQSALATDAGSWLPLLTHHQVTIPPQYALLAERSSVKDYTVAVNNLTKTLAEQPTNMPLDKAALCQFPQAITHVYIGQKRGLVTKAIPNAPTTAMLSPEILHQDPAFKLVYQQDRVLIFEFNRAICHD